MKWTKTTEGLPLVGKSGISVDLCVYCETVIKKGEYVKGSNPTEYTDIKYKTIEYEVTYRNRDTDGNAVDPYWLVYRNQMPYRLFIEDDGGGVNVTHWLQVQPPSDA